LVKNNKLSSVILIDAYLEYYSMAQPKKVEEMNEWEWAVRWAVLKDIRQKESKHTGF
jgi:hypothetical protein